MKSELLVLEVRYFIESIEIFLSERTVWQRHSFIFTQGTFAVPKSWWIYLNWSTSLIITYNSWLIVKIWLLNLIYLSFLDFFVTWRNHSWWPCIGRSSVTLPVKRLIRGVFGIFVLRGLGSAFSKNFRKILGASCLKNEFPDIEHAPNYSSSLVVKMFKLKYLSAVVFQLKLTQVYPTTKFALSDNS